MIRHYKTYWETVDDGDMEYRSPFGMNDIRGRKLVSDDKNGLIFCADTTDEQHKALISLDGVSEHTP
ncbi:MAG: hypothetical protein AAFY24_01915 [Pseudomonadota bacterium]